MPRTVVLVGNPRPNSRTLTAALTVARTLRAEAGTETLLDLAGHVVIGFSAEPVHPSAPAPHALQHVRSADLLVVATPSYKGTFTGLLKVFLDQLPHQGLAGVEAVPVAVASSQAHADATAGALRVLLEELGARVPAGVALLDSRLGEDGYVEAEARRGLAPAAVD